VFLDAGICVFMTELQAQSDPSPSQFQCGRFEFSLQRPLIMGVLNLTPDSFSDGGRHDTFEAALDQARALIAAGADILDLGAESTRPGAASVPADDELRRLLPLIEALREYPVPLSVDTRKPDVMRAVIAAGADMINDVGGFRLPEAIEAVAQSGCGLCVMHMQGDPATMQHQPRYQDVVEEVGAFLRERIAMLVSAGIDRSRIVIDPGIGFGKTLSHNLALIAATARLSAIAPVLVGVSRKSMLGEITGRPVDQRLAASLSAALAAVSRGARIVRVHDVAQTRDAMAVWCAVTKAG
jgi:dihydropteroate synthase